MPKATTAIAYVRVSVVGNRAARGRLESPELQRASIDGWCAQRGISVVDEVQDLNRSGGTLTRPGLSAALQRIPGDADGIVVARSDRASRRTIDGLGLIDLLDKRGGWIAAADGTLDTTDRVARMATTMMLAVGQHELDRFKEQSAETHRRAILEKGRHMGPAPFGYVRDAEGRLAVDAEDAAIVRLVFERRADGAGWVAIARELEAVRQASGRRLTPHLLRRLVRRRVYLGEASHGEHVKAGAHAAIVDEGSWAAANRVRPVVRSEPAARRVHEDSLLRGLLRCAGCRYVLKRLPQLSGRPPRWACRTMISDRAATHECSAPARLTQTQGIETEALVVAEFMALAQGVEAVSDTAAQEAEGAERRAQEAEALLDELSSLEVRRTLGAERWSTMTAAARESLEVAQRELGAVRARRRSVGTADRATLEEVWDEMVMAERQEALRSLVQAVMVRAGDAAVADRVRVLPVWVDVDLPRKGAEFTARPWTP